MSKQRSKGHLGPGTRHTPGPWRIFAGYGHEYIYDSEGRTEYASDSIAVAYQNARTDKATAQANARLIAAAPELLEACKAMRDRLTELANADDRCWHDWAGAYAADAAIAKATL